MRFTFRSDLWRWDGKPQLYTFVTVPEDESAEIAEIVGELTNGWGSSRVDVSIGATTFRTSIFPDGTSGTYMIPVKRAVRKAEGIDIDDIVEVTIELVDF